MSTERFANNAQSTLAAAIGAADLTLTVADATAFPSQPQFRILIDSEILLVTAVAGNTFTVTRAAEAVAGVQAASAHLAHTYVTHVITAGALGNLLPASLVNTFDGRTGAVTLTSADVTAALGYSDIARTGSANTFTAAPQQLTVSGKTLQFARDTKTITTSDAELVMEQTGDTFGTTRLRLQNRGGSNGALFENAGLNLVDFGFSAGSQLNLRMENRGGGGTNAVSAPEMQVLDSGGHYYFCVGSSGNSGIVCALGTDGAHTPTFQFACYTSVATFRQMGRLEGSWVVSTDASRTGRVVAYASDSGGSREVWRIESSGSAAMLSFYGVAAVARQVLATGAGHTVDDVIAALQNLGLVKQS
jgi:hypothetical protein